MGSDPAQAPHSTPPSGSRARGVLLRLAPSLLLVAIFLLGFLGRPENSAWLNRSAVWGPGDPFFENTEERFIANPLVVWRGRPGYRGHAAYPFAGARNPFAHNALGLRDDEVGPKPPGVVRVVNVGDSSTWGLNLESRRDTYSDQLEARLSSRDERFEVINAGTIGYSSFQGLQFLRGWLDALDPDVVTIYLGNNDPAAARLEDADRVSTTLLPLRRWLSGNAFYLLLRKGVLALRSAELASDWERFEALVKGRGRSPVFRDKAIYYRELARVSPEEYEANLRATVELLREAGVRPLLLEVPANPLWPLAVHPTLERYALRKGELWSAVYIAPGYLRRAARGRPPAGRPLPGHPYLSLVTEADLAARWPDGSGTRFVEKTRADLASGNVDAIDRIRLRNNLAVAELAADRLGRASREVELAHALAERCRPCPPPLDHAQLLHTLGVVRWLEGRRQEAFVHLAAARGVWPFAMSPDYAARFDAVVAQLDVEWIDLPAAFAGEDPEFGGSLLISDWVHPNARGNALIARAIDEAL